MEFKGNIFSTTSTESTSYLADTGSADAYAVALRPAITAYTTGLRITFQAANANTGSSTLAVNGLATKTIKKSVSTNLASGDILQNQIITVIYDGTNFQMASGTGGGAGTSGYSGYCGLSGYSGFSGTSGYSGYCGLSGYSGYSGSGISGYSGYSGISGFSGTVKVQAYKLTTGNSTVTGSSFTTASITPTPNRLVLVTVSQRTSSGAAVAPTLSGNSLTYVNYTSQNNSNDTQNRINVFRAMGNAPTAGAVTIDFGGVNQASCEWSVVEFDNVNTSGTNGSGAVRGGTIGSSSPSVTTYVANASSGGFQSAANATYAGFAVNSNQTLTGDSNFTVLDTQAVASNSLLTEWSNINQINANVTGTSTNFVGFALEIINASAGVSGYSGFCGLSGYSGYSSTSGYSGFSGPSGYSGYCGLSGYSGYSGSGISGYSGYSGSGISGYSGYSGSGASGYSGFCGLSGYSGYSSTSGYSGYCGLSGYSGYSGSGISGYSGYSGSGLSGYSGYSGSGISGYSGYSGSGLSGYSGFCGLSGYSGFCGLSGYSGFCGLSGYSGFSGKSGYSGYSGPSLLTFTTQTDVDYTLVFADENTGVKMNSSSAHNLTVPPNSSVAFDIGAQIIIEQAGTGTVTIVAGGGVTLQGAQLTTSGQYSTIVLIKQATDTWLVGTGNSGYSGYSGNSGYSGYSGPGLAKILLVENGNLQEVAGTIVSKAGTITGTAGVGSSLFLQRLLIPAVMNLTEIDMALSIGFPATNQGAGTLSRSMVIYSLGNSTSLASVMSISGTSAWQTGTSTTAGAASLTMFQGGWSTPLIQPMTFAATSLSAGEYVVGQLFNFAQGSSTWTLNFYGMQALSTFLASAATNLTSATLGALSSGGLLAGSVHTATANVIALSTLGTSAFARVQTSTSSSQTVAMTALTAVNAASALSSGGLSAGSFLTASGSLGAVTNVALGALASSTLAQATLPNFGFIGTGSTTSNFPTVFINGIMSTGAIPTAITLTSTAVTYSGSIAFQQPWFALIGS